MDKLDCVRTRRSQKERIQRSNILCVKRSREAGPWGKKTIVTDCTLDILRQLGYKVKEILVSLTENSTMDCYRCDINSEQATDCKSALYSELDKAKDI